MNKETKNTPGMKEFVNYACKLGMNIIIILFECESFKNRRKLLLNFDR